jgi:hypothetical protein
VHISRVPTMWPPKTVQADSDAQAFDLAIDWAVSVHLAPDDNIDLAIRLLSGALKTFSRKDFLRPNRAAPHF